MGSAETCRSGVGVVSAVNSLVPRPTRSGNARTGTRRRGPVQRVRARRWRCRQRRGCALPSVRPPPREGLGEWGQRWARSDYRADELDPGLLLWDIRRNRQPGGLGERPATIQFVSASLPTERRFYWLVVDAHDVDLCLIDPGREVDVTVEADLGTLTKVWMGDADFADALADRRIVLRGPTRLTRRIPGLVRPTPGFRQNPTSPIRHPPHVTLPCVCPLSFLSVCGYRSPARSRRRSSIRV